MDKRADSDEAAQRAANAERNLGRYVAFGLPAVTVFMALGVLFVSSLGPALLVLAGGALLGTVALFWASVRTLSGDAPLPTELEMLAARRPAVDALAEKKQRILVALKDLEHERAVGKIDETDYAEISAAYREQAKDLMREMDVEIEPLRERATKIAENYLKKRGLSAVARDEAPGAAPNVVPAAEDSTEELAAATPARVACGSCETSNEHDAAFCKKCGASLKQAPVDAALPDEEKKDARA